jgi:hypothetical protein
MTGLLWKSDTVTIEPWIDCHLLDGQVCSGIDLV